MEISKSAYTCPAVLEIQIAIIQLNNYPQETRKTRAVRELEERLDKETRREDGERR